MNSTRPTGAGQGTRTRSSPEPPATPRIPRRTFLRGGLGGVLALAVGTALAPAVHAASPARGGVDQFDADVATAWFDLALRLVRETPGYSPPVASRAFAYLGATLYEAVVPGMPGHRSLSGRLSGLGPLPQAGRSTAYDWPTTANAAMAEIVRALFPTVSPRNRDAVNRLEISGEDSSLPPGLRRRSEQRGRDVARAIFDWSHNDGGHEGYERNADPAYVAPARPGTWTPTPPGFLPALQPYWGANRTFVVAGGSACPAGPHTPFDEQAGSAFFADAVEVYEVVNQLSDEQLSIARFWADDPGATATPPGHSMAITTQLLRETGESLDVAADVCLRLGTALADAFICCWHVKYTTNLLRPVSFIQAMIDPDWLPPVTTPPFPEYTSGHSVQSAAAAEVLQHSFGVRAFTDRTHEDRGLGVRSFLSFHEAAAEAAISRLYGGIHYRPAIELGLDQGRCVGRAAVRLKLAA